MEESGQLRALVCVSDKKAPYYPPNRKVSGPQSQSWSFREERDFLAPARNRNQNSCHSSHCLFITDYTDWAAQLHLPVLI